MPNLAHLLRPDDCPRRERKTPRPLTAEHDQLLQQELVRRNDLASNVLLLLRHTGIFTLSLLQLFLLEEVRKLVMEQVKGLILTK